MQKSTLAVDAGDTIFGQWGICNPLVHWLLQKAPDLLSETPTSLHRRDPLPPICPRAGNDKHRMVRYPAAYKCYRHVMSDDVVPEIAVRPKYERAPRLDVLSKTNKMLDWQFDPDTGKRVVVETEL